MTYVDDPVWPFGRMMMCHLLADNLDELHRMADSIGIARRWFQRKPGGVPRTKNRKVTMTSMPTPMPLALMEPAWHTAELANEIGLYDASDARLLEMLDLQKQFLTSIPSTRLAWTGETYRFLPQEGRSRHLHRASVEYARLDGNAQYIASFIEGLIIARFRGIVSQRQEAAAKSAHAKRLKRIQREASQRRAA